MFVSKYVGIPLSLSLYQYSIPTFLLHVALIRRTNGRKPGDLPENSAVSKLGEHWIKKS